MMPTDQGRVHDVLLWTSHDPQNVIIYLPDEQDTVCTNG